MNLLEKYQVRIDTSIRDSIKKMDVEDIDFLAVTDFKDKVIGVFTSGDFRESVLKGVDISESVETVVNKNFHYLEYGYEENIADNLFLEEMIAHIPVIKSGKLIDIIERTDSKSRNKNVCYDNNVIIMAGGKGTRLKPFTAILPKPLIPIGDQSIIEIIMENFRKSGFDKFYITLNNKSKIIKSYLDQLEYSVKYVDEQKELGTAGSLGMIKNEVSDTFFVINCDVIIDDDYEKILEFHNNNNFDITIVSSLREQSVPYGVCMLDSNGALSSISEKPTYDYLVNTGMYVLQSDIIEAIPDDVFYDMTDLINDVLNKNRKIGLYPVSHSSWLDVGQWDMYKETIKILSLV